MTATGATTTTTTTTTTTHGGGALTTALGNLFYKKKNNKDNDNDDDGIVVTVVDKRKMKMMSQRKSVSQPSLLTSRAAAETLYGIDKYYIDNNHNDDDESIDETDRDMTDHSMSSFDDDNDIDRDQDLGRDIVDEEVMDGDLSSSSCNVHEDGEEQEDLDALPSSDNQDGVIEEDIIGGSRNVENCSLLTAPIPKLDYQSIPSIDDYADLVHSNKYIRLPSNWCVIVTDIVSSTKHIENGRYRDVNTVGVMTICAVRNALGIHKDFPYVFGGDGSSLVVKPEQEQLVLHTLLALRRVVRANYQMELRVGSVSIEELEDHGVTVEVTRYEIVSGMCIALFRGGGLALADAIIKSRPDYEQLQETIESSTITPNMDGLSCRWKKIPNRNGCVLTLLVMDNPDIVVVDEDETDEHGHDDGNSDESESDDEDNVTMKMYQRVIIKLQEILKPQTMKKANPVNPELAEYKTAPEMIADEQRMHESKISPSYINRAVEIGLCHVLFRWKKLQHAIIDAPEYVQGMRTHADHRKFDDMIRMVIDCTPDQADAIEQYLQGMYDDGRQIFFGTQRSQHTLMTCLLKDTNDGNHIHFVDGDLGGYAIAAKTLKMQLGSYAMAKRNRELKLLRQKQKEASLKRRQQQQRERRSDKDRSARRDGNVGTTKRKQRFRTM